MMHKRFKNRVDLLVKPQYIMADVKAVPQISKTGRKKGQTKYDPTPADVRDTRKVRRFAFTYHNPTDEDEKSKLPQVFSEKRFAKFSFQKEIAPTTKIPHIQGVYETVNPHTLSAEVKFLGKLFSGIHIERAVGSWEANLRYVTKEDTRAPGTVPTVRDTHKERLVEKNLNALRQYLELLENDKADRYSRPSFDVSETAYDDLLRKILDHPNYIKQYKGMVP